MTTIDDINNWFVYHTPTPEQVQVYAGLRAAGLDFAACIVRDVPSGIEQDQAIDALREAVMWANAGIACAKESACPPCGNTVAG